MPRVETAKGAKVAESKEREAGWSLESLRIERADNGFVLYEELRRETKAATRGASAGPEMPSVGRDYQTDRRVFTDAKSLAAYVEAELTAHVPTRA